MEENAEGASTQNPPQVSPDGRFWWNGHEWVPFQQGSQPEVVVTRKEETKGSAALGIAIGVLAILGLLVVFMVFGG